MKFQNYGSWGLGWLILTEQNWFMSTRKARRGENRKNRQVSWPRYFRDLVLKTFFFLATLPLLPKIRLSCSHFKLIMAINHLTNLTLPTGDFSDHPSTPIHGGQRRTPRNRHFNSSRIFNYHNNSNKFRVMMMKKKLDRFRFLRLKNVVTVLLMGLFFLVNWWILIRIQDSGRVAQALKLSSLKPNLTTLSIPVCPILLL